MISDTCPVYFFWKSIHTPDIRKKYREADIPPYSVFIKSWACGTLQTSLSLTQLHVVVSSSNPALALSSSNPALGLSSHPSYSQNGLF